MNLSPENTAVSVPCEILYYYNINFSISKEDRQNRSGTDSSGQPAIDSFAEYAYFN